MSDKTSKFIQNYIKKDIPDIRPGDTVRVNQTIKEGEKERIQSFEGLVLARKHGKEIGATITVRKVISGVGVEKVFPLHSPLIQKIEIIREGKVKRAKLYYIRTAKGRKAKIKHKEFAEAIAGEPPKEAGQQESLQAETTEEKQAE